MGKMEFHDGSVMESEVVSGEVRMRVTWSLSAEEILHPLTGVADGLREAEDARALEALGGALARSYRSDLESLEKIFPSIVGNEEVEG